MYRGTKRTNNYYVFSLFQLTGTHLAAYIFPKFLTVSSRLKILFALKLFFDNISSRLLKNLSASLLNTGYPILIGLNHNYPKDKSLFRFVSSGKILKMKSIRQHIFAGVSLLVRPRFDFIFRVIITEYLFILAIIKSLWVISNKISKHNYCKARLISKFVT